MSWECELGNVSWEKCELALYPINGTEEEKKLYTKFIKYYKKFG